MASRARFRLGVVAVVSAAVTTAACLHCGGDGVTPSSPLDAGAADVALETSPGDDGGRDGGGDVSSPIDAGDPCALGFVLAPDCVHPPVVKDCAGGWCKIPHGCFILGSNRCEVGRGKYDEDPVQMTLTHDFEIQTTEFSQAAWEALGFANPTVATPTVDNWASCVAPTCPVTYLAWVETLAIANALSLKANLPTCYDLSACTGTPGQKNMSCTDVQTTTASVYECKGYRLPTEVEWEYAARAGTRTAYYSGDPAPIPPFLKCIDDPSFNPIGWYCNNGGNVTHPAAQKSANGWGLYDMLGNVTELTTSLYTGAGYGPSPQVDRDAKFPVVSNFNMYEQRGGFAMWYASSSRASGRWNYGPPNVNGGPTMGFRLVRTLFPADGGVADASGD